MADFPAVRDPGSIELLLNHIRTNDPPEKVSEDYLVAAGFRRETDESLEMLLTFLGFTDPDGLPTELWSGVRHKGRGPKLLGEAVKAGYWKLFKAVPEAQSADGRPLMDFFKKETRTGDQEAAYMILTFKVLCDLAKLGEVQKQERKQEEPARRSKAAKSESPAAPEPDVGLERAFAEEAATGQADSRAQASSAAPRGETGGSCRITIQIDLDPGVDEELRAAMLELVRKQLAKD
ncbi:DUF5343 domain-containing protein [Candidatus Fermentibacterales bacterium]|nr:DUF5343 domain-containing protein [Candidatus Fermentibacterales bacterium]